jgi:serine protease Do
MPPEPVNELQLQARALEGRAWRATPVRRAQKAWLGLRTRDLGSQLAEYFGVKEGLLVAEVLDAGPAHHAGVLAGDVIIAVDSHTVQSYEDLDRLVDCCEPGKTVSVLLLRKGDALKKEVTLASAP